jgi:hypothetical protein
VAARHRADFGLERARRVGQRLVERLDLQPPVPISDVLAQFAEVEYVGIPSGCDAVVYGLRRARPSVIADPYQPPKRLRFSLAHELGHILVPGHLGIEACHTSSRFYYGLSSQEREAHAFASEVLVPRRWLQSIVASGRTPGEAIEAVEDADVSAAAGCLALIRALPGGTVLTLMNGRTVEMALAAPETTAALPEQNAELDAAQLDAFASARGSAELSGRQVRWWSFDTEVPVAPSSDTRTSRELLREIVRDVFPLDESSQDKAYASVMAISGHAKGAYRFDSVERLHSNLRQRFASRPNHAAVVAHPMFQVYLAVRAREMSSN